MKIKSHRNSKHTIKVWVIYKASMEVKRQGIQITNIKITVKGFIK